MTCDQLRHTPAFLSGEAYIQILTEVEVWQVRLVGDAYEARPSFTGGETWNPWRTVTWSAEQLAVEAVLVGAER